MKYLIIVLICFSQLLFAKLSFVDPHVRLMPPGLKVSVGFVKIKNSSDKPIELISATSTWAKTIELHIHALEDGVMAMRQVDKMVIPANGEFALKSKGPHLMIFKIQEELKEGREMEMNLKFSDGSAHKVKFIVRKL